jgi:ubiquinone/menaquinone biosynthesis C-methylase UbiE
MNDTDIDATCSPLEGIQTLYAELAMHPEKEFGWGKGKENARRLGYDERWLESLPDVAWESAAAVGNPFAPGPLKSGELVVDLGCGAGADLCIAALLVGNAGGAVGIDVTPAMIAKARDVANAVGLENAELHVANMETLPLADASVDVVISNGAINLSAHKPCVFKEIFRVLKPGGRLQFADMVRDGADEIPSCGSWADCVSGTVEPQRYLEMLSAAGFMESELVSLTGYRTAANTIGATFRARKP